VSRQGTGSYPWTYRLGAAGHQLLQHAELFGATFRQASPSRFRVGQVLTKATDGSGSNKPVGRIISAAKTAEGVRTMAMRPWLYDELRRWRDLLVSVGLPGRDDDFIIPGAAAAGHYTLEQQHNFIRDVKACGRVASEHDPDLRFLKKATPYSLRRGHISLHLKLDVVDEERFSSGAFAQILVPKR
jgi:hypothetical protein